MEVITSLFQQLQLKVVMASEVLPDLFCYTIQIVNICFVGNPKTNDFVLVDAGMPKCANEIISVTEERFGTNSRPKAIILTHGHFDHVGGIIELIKYWDVPVYAHQMEIPFLTDNKAILNQIQQLKVVW